jgi:hypothetical protein
MTTISKYYEVYNFKAGGIGLYITPTGAVGSFGIYSALGDNNDSVFNEGLVHASPENSGVNFASSGGKVTNGTSTYEGALIEGLNGVYARGLGTVVNYGTIEGIVSYTGKLNGVQLYDGGLIQNGYATDRTALIEGFTGVSVGPGGLSGAKSFIFNNGTIVGSKNAAVLLSSFCDVYNGSGADTAATLEGDVAGVTLTVAASDRIVNYGVIEGNDGVTATQYGFIANRGTISGLGQFSYAISMSQGGYVTNGGATDRTALVEGFDGILFQDAPGTVHNAGTILAIGQSMGRGSGTGVVLFSGGVLTNGSADNDVALIEGPSGVHLRGVGASVNYGTIEGLGGAGYFGAYVAGPSLTNGASGHAGALIEGDIGAEVGGTGILTNFGVIDGADGVAVQLEASTATLVAEAGSVFKGSVTGDGGTLALGSGGGTISGLAGGDVTVSGSMPTTTFDDFGTLEIGAGASFTLTGTDSLAAGHSLIDDGTLVVTGALTSAGTLGGTGTVDFTAGSDSLTGGTLSVAHLNVTGATVTLSGKIAVPSVVSFSGKLLVANGTTLTGAGAIVLTDSASNEITGTRATSVLTNDMRIEGEGQVGAGAMELTNAASGSIYSLGAGTLTLNTGTSTILNAGAIAAEGTGGLTISSPLDNTGELIAYSSPLTVSGAVSGAGTAEVENAATLILKGAFNENVTFASGSTGALELGDSKGYTTGAITGFSKTGTNSLDLLDIPFVSGTTTATYSGTTASGVLTVKDGANVATIHLEGNYTTSTFTVSAGPGGVGTKVVDPGRASASPHAAAPLSPHPFIAAMAGFGARATGATPLAGGFWRTPPPMLAASRALA